MKRADRLSAISHDVANRAKTYCPTRIIDVLPPGFPDPAPLPQQTPHSDFVICSTSRLAARKGLDLIIRALAELRDLPIRYIVIGDGAMQKSLKELAEKKGVSDRIQWCGFVSQQEKYELLSQSDAFVLPSLHEGFGLAYVEAMASGLPIVASREGGHVDFMQDESNGILLKERSVEALVDGICRLYHDPSLRKKMSVANQEKAVRYYACHLAKEYLMYYQEMCTSQPNKRNP